mmetsp:Transcript_24257/g.52808  ORF Transcript_24257/g.52808 Transcript_24257/m.52808 type:complete len:107 (+) Transcript_24257:80-400(+)
MRFFSSKVSTDRGFVSASIHWDIHSRPVLGLPPTSAERGEPCAAMAPEEVPLGKKGEAAKGSGGSGSGEGEGEGEGRDCGTRGEGKGEGEVGVKVKFGSARLELAG